MASPALLFRQLSGVFAVYKHANVSAQSLRRKVLKKIVEDLDAGERIQKQMVQYLPAKNAELLAPASSTSHNNSSITSTRNAVIERAPVNVTDWFDHPLVQGSRYAAEDLNSSLGHVLDVKASGVQLIGLQQKGEYVLNKLNKLSVPRSYYLHGRFGLATITFDGEGKVIERSTWDHITEAKISRLLCIIQGTYRNALIKGSNLDLESQHAYEMVSQGLLKPNVPTGPMILDLKLVKLDPPDFIIDATCVNESCQFLRKLVHEIGLELRSSAICMKLRRYRDGIFFAEDETTLLSREISAEKLVDIISTNLENLDPIFKQKRAVFSPTGVEDEEVMDATG